MMKRTFSIAGIMILLTILLSKGFAQEVELRVNAKSIVQVGEQFRVTYTVNSQASNFIGPAFDGFRVLSGPNQSTNQSYQIINGKVSQSFEQSFTYYLQATREGTFNIPAASVTVSGKKYDSNPVSISVSQASAPPSGQNPQGKVSSNQYQGEGISKEDVFIRATADKSNPYQGEQVIITYRIYTKVPISQLNVSKLSSFQGFWYKSLMDDSAPLKQSSETINGQEYIVAELRKLAVYAQRTGEITIDPMELACIAQLKVTPTRPRDPFFDSFFDDPFFNRNVKNIELNLVSNTLTIKVKPLPQDNRPANFSGAVGQFTMSTDIDRTQLKANEPVVLKVTISGKGNIELIDQVNINFPPDFETYDPKIANNISATAAGISGSRAFEYLAIPRNAGQFTIKPITFSYFDLAKNSYITLTGPEYTIRVEKGDQESTGITYSGVSQKDIQFIGSDIRHIRTSVMHLVRVNSHFYGSSSFILWLVAPLLLFIAVVLVLNANDRRRGNIALVKNRQANKVARKNLRKADEFLKSGQTEAFYVEISRALWGYISNKFNIPLSELSIETVSHRLESKSVSPESISEFTAVLDSCEYARFAPGDKSRKMNEIYEAALLIISKIENELK
jgi:hypothetical protein